MEALALKYRPRNFSALIGQEAVSKSLTHALKEGRIGNAYLFSGLRGSGKTSSARIFAKALVCENGPTPTPCEVCPQCRMANEGRHIDIIEMDAASNGGVDNIRELIEHTQYSPTTARFKIFILDEVHMLSTGASNALLKTLEEPPSYVKFILATTDPLKLPATVLSRTQHFRFKQIPRYAILKHLEFILAQEGISYERQALEILARSGSGSLRDTITLLEQAISYSAGAGLKQDVVAKMLGILDPAQIERILQVVASQDRGAVAGLVQEFEGVDAEMMIGEILASLKEKFLNSDPAFSLLVYERFFRILSQSKASLSLTADTGFVITLMLFMMIEAMSLRSIDEAIGAFSPPPSLGANANQMPANQIPNLQNNMSNNMQNNQHNTLHNNTQNNTNFTQQALNSQMPTQVNQAPNQTTTQEWQASPTQATNNTQQSQDPIYKGFLERIYDRDFELGECFERVISFVGFDGEKLVLSSSASGADQARLRDSSKVIMAILRNTFGQNARIEIISQKNTSKSDEKSLDKDIPPRNLTTDSEFSAPKPPRPELVPAVSRDNSEDFMIAYGANKPSISELINLDELEMDLNRIESELESAPNQSQVARFDLNLKPENTNKAKEFEQDLLEQDLASFSSQIQDEQVAQQTSQTSKNLGGLSALISQDPAEADKRREALALDELKRLFGEPKQG